LAEQAQRDSIELDSCLKEKVYLNLVIFTAKQEASDLRVSNTALNNANRDCAKITQNYIVALGAQVRLTRRQKLYKYLLGIGWFTSTMAEGYYFIHK
jgi:hypothetical protein